jgi:hypothetical protein
MGKQIYNSRFNVGDTVWYRVSGENTEIDEKPYQVTGIVTTHTLTNIRFEYRISPPGYADCYKGYSVIEDELFASLEEAKTRIWVDDDDEGGSSWLKKAIQGV